MATADRAAGRARQAQSAGFDHADAQWAYASPQRSRHAVIPRSASANDNDQRAFTIGARAASSQRISATRR
jgi:hypothetical protein